MIDFILNSAKYNEIYFVLSVKWKFFLQPC